MLITFRIIMVFSVLFATASWAQDDKSWDWRFAPYLWGVNIDGSMQVGPITQDMDTSFSDIWSNLDFGGAFLTEVGKRPHSFHIDYTYLRLKPDANNLPSPPFAPGSEIKPKITVNILETGYNYALDNLSLVFGARYIDLEMKMALDLTGPLPIDPGPLQAGPSWWDLFVGMKTQHAISTNWDFDMYGTVGFGESDWPWTLQGMFARRFTNGNRLGFGVRVWGLDYSENENVIGKYSRLDATLYGFVVGYEFN